MRRDSRLGRAMVSAAALFLLFVAGYALGFRDQRDKRGTFWIASDILRFVRDVRDPVGREKLAMGYAFQHLQPSRDGLAGVTTGAGLDDGRQVLLVGFFDGENQARLIRRDGSVVQKWHLTYTDQFPPGSRRMCKHDVPLAADVHGAFLNRKGELIFNYEFCGTAKLDRCGRTLWTYSHAGHHNVTPSAKGGYWVLDRVARSPDAMMPPYSDSRSNAFFLVDRIQRVDGATGKVLVTKSIPRIFHDSGLDAVLTTNVSMMNTAKPIFPELVHANKIAELRASMADRFPEFRTGDLLISLRYKNLIAVIDGRTWKVKWWQIGPWLRQHDPEFRSDGRISVFDNNTFPMTYTKFDQLVAGTKAYSEIVAVDPVTRKTRVIYGNESDQHFLSVIRGQHEYLANGDMMVADFDGGRAFEVDPSGRMVWEYVNRYNDRYVGEMTHAIPFAPGYFEVPFGQCT